MIFNKVKYDLIVTIVSKGYSEDVVKYAKKAGAEGSTILSGRGTGDHDAAKLFGILIEPEKEIILTVVSDAKTNEILETICDKLKLDEPGNGIAFVLDITKCSGIHDTNK